MLKSRKKLLLGLAAIGSIASIGVFVACGPSIQARTQTTTPAPAADSIRVAVTDPDNPRWVKANNALLAALEANNEGGFANITKEQNNQNTFIEQALALNPTPKGLIIAPENGGGVSTVVNNAKDKGVPVVAYDRLITSTTSYDWYVTYDNNRVGTLQGLALASGLLGAPEPFSDVTAMETYLKANMPTEKIGFYSLGGSPNDNNAKLFYKGAIEVLDKLIAGANGMIVNVGDVTEASVLISGWDYPTAQKKMDQFFTQHELGQDGKFKAGTSPSNVALTGITLKGILAPNDGMANASINSLRQRGVDLSKVYITGQDFNNDGIRGIEANEQNMTIYKPDTELAMIAVKLLLELIKNKGLDAATAKNVDAIFEEVKKGFKAAGFNTEIILDKTNYKSDATNNSAGTHVINTILLAPTVVTSANIAAVKAADLKASQ